MSYKPKKAKTQGLEWLVHSINAFNGSGYADMNSPEDYLDSYVAYNTMRKRPDAVRLAQIYKVEVLPMIEALLEKTAGAGRKPAPKHVEAFEKFRKHNQAELL